VRPTLPDSQRQATRLPLYLQPPLPSVFTFEITARCQHRCAGCGNVFTHSNTEIDLAGWRRIIARLQPYIQALRITGGEPTLHPQFDLLLQEIDRLQVPYVLFTNGNWAHPQTTLQLLQDCRNLKGLLVSLHGSDPDTFRRFTGLDAFDRVLANIRLAASVGLRVATNTLLLSTTVDQLPGIADLVLSAGAANVSFGRYYGPFLPAFSPTEAQLKQALSQIARLRRADRRISLSNCVPLCFPEEQDFGGGGCTSGLTHCTIGPLGEVRPCTHSELVLGHMPGNDLEQLWRSPALLGWRDLIPDHCLDCSALNVCRGGCRAVAQKLGLPHDPLQREALKDVGPAVVELGLQDRPLLSCGRKDTDFGIALSGAGHYITLSRQSRPILDMLDGTTTLETIQKEFGPASLELIGGLVRQNLVELQ
jgi:radical SAM protein with 4Fe4S-binding SPASM domain